MLIFNFKYSIELSFSVYINPWSQVQSPCSYINCASQFQVVIFCCLQVSTKLCFTAYMANSTLQIPVLDSGIKSLIQQLTLNSIYLQSHIMEKFVIYRYVRDTGSVLIEQISNNIDMEADCY